jgi:glycosyltransferase involved in cell wall biosynthesis
MRVGVVTTSYPRADGDPAGSFVAAHVDWLVRAGHVVEVLCAAAAEPHGQWQPGVRVVPVPAPPGLFYAGGAPEALSARGPAAAADVARFSAALLGAVHGHARCWDAAFAHWLVPGAAALALAAPPGLDLVAIAHSGDVHVLRRLGLATPLAWSLIRRHARFAFVSEHVRTRFLDGVWPAPLRRRVHARSLVTPMGIELDRWRAAARAVQRDPGLRTVLFLGRLVPIKGAAVLLDAVAQLPPGCGPVRVVVAGDGPLREALADQARALVARRQSQHRPEQRPEHRPELRSELPGELSIELVGEVRGAARDRLLAAADVLVLPSLPVAGGRSEGAPVTALEAMAAGVPVVAARTGGLAELPAEAAMLVPPGDAAALAQALTRCLTDHALRARQAHAASRWVARYDWSEVGAKLWALVAD